MSALQGIRVVEIASERCAFAGKLMGDMGADVILVERPGGDSSRGYGPFYEGNQSETAGRDSDAAGNDVSPDAGRARNAETESNDAAHRERSLYFWHYNTSKRGVVLELDDERARRDFEKLISTADVLLESEPPGRLATLGIDYENLVATKPDLIHVSITPFGRENTRRDEPATDLTILSGGGPVWSCGYDDHSIPPIRGGGNQGYQTACHYAVLAALTAIFHHGASGEGQFVDVSMHAAANITTEMSSYFWLVQEATVVRQTGRHAMPIMTMPTQILCADGRYASSGVPPRTPAGFGDLYDWLDELGLVPELPEAIFLDEARRRESISFDGIGVDDEVTAIFTAARDAMNLLASRLTAIEFFEGAQKLGITVGVIYSPEEAFEDRHFVARGFQTEVEHADLGRTLRYPGAPYKLPASPWRIQRPAPKLGEHQDEVFSEIED